MNEITMRGLEQIARYFGETRYRGDLPVPDFEIVDDVLRAADLPIDPYDLTDSQRDRIVKAYSG